MKIDPTSENMTAVAECNLNCDCHSAGCKPGCAISHVIHGDIYFTNSKHATGCAFEHPFGSSFMCLCPVRQELFRKQKV
jgi:hypothetical protein